MRYTLLDARRPDSSSADAGRAPPVPVPNSRPITISIWPSNETAGPRGSPEREQLSPSTRRPSPLSPLSSLCGCVQGTAMSIRRAALACIDTCHPRSGLPSDDDVPQALLAQFDGATQKNDSHDEGSYLSSSTDRLVRVEPPWSGFSRLTRQQYDRIVAAPTPEERWFTPRDGWPHVRCCSLTFYFPVTIVCPG